MSHIETDQVDVVTCHFVRDHLTGDLFHMFDDVFIVQIKQRVVENILVVHCVLDEVTTDITTCKQLGVFLIACDELDVVVEQLFVQRTVKSNVFEQAV